MQEIIPWHCVGRAVWRVQPVRVEARLTPGDGQFEVGACVDGTDVGGRMSGRHCFFRVAVVLGSVTSLRRNLAIR